jgi:hypothetical protein
MNVEIRKALEEDFNGILNDPTSIMVCGAYLRASVTAWTGLIHPSGIACIWGLVSPTVLSDSAYLWLLTTPVVDDHKFTFVRHSQLVLDRMLEDFPTIVGHVLADQTRSKRWLKWLGVTFEPSIQAGSTHLTPFKLRRALRG